jgi:AcrR family transcriptional regulator
MSLRKEILKAGRKMLLDEGISNISMRKIAGEIDVSATSIYLHFRNKNHLLYTLIEESIEELNRLIRDIVNTDRDPLAKMESIARTYVAFGLDRPQEYEVIFMLRPDEMPRYPKEKFRKAREGYELLAEVIREGVDKGEMKEENPLRAAYAIWAQLHGIVSVVVNRRLDTRISVNEFINHAIVHLIRGIQINSHSQVTI